MRNLLLAGVCAAALMGNPALADDIKQGGEMTVTYKDDVSTLDPAIGYDWQNWSMIKSLFDGLMDYVPGTTELRPDLAESYEISEDGKIFTFKLRKGVKFHNGRELTAQDVKYSIERVVNPATQSPGAGFFATIKGVEEASAGKGGAAVRHHGAGSAHDQVRTDPPRRHFPPRHGAQLCPCRAEGGGRETRRRFR